MHGGRNKKLLFHNNNNNNLSTVMMLHIIFIRVQFTYSRNKQKEVSKNPLMARLEILGQATDGENC
jgi:hypothetical protein